MWYNVKKVEKGTAMENKERKADRRVAKTKRAIRSAFVKLLTEKEADKITVKEIADLADVDRKTVYNYYKGVQDIFGELEIELVQSFQKKMMAFEFDPTHPQEIFYALTSVLKDEFEIYELLMRLESSSNFISKIVVFLKKKFCLVMENYKPIAPMKIDLAAEYLAAGIFSAYRCWFNSDRAQSLEEFTDDIALLVMGGLPQYLLYN